MHALTHLKLLISLAQVDGRVADREKNYILNIGKANGVSEDQLQNLFKKEHEVILPKDLSKDEKFDCIYTLVQLMKIDERMYQEEIRFCAEIASRLGYEQEVLAELMLQVKGNSMEAKEILRLKTITEKFLK